MVPNHDSRYAREASRDELRTDARAEDRNFILVQGWGFSGLSTTARRGDQDPCRSRPRPRSGSEESALVSSHDQKIRLRPSSAPSATHNLFGTDFVGGYAGLNSSTPRSRKVRVRGIKPSRVVFPARADVTSPLCLAGDLSLILQCWFGCGRDVIQVGGDPGPSG